MEDQNNSLRMNFVEAHSSLDHLSKKLTNVKPDKVQEVTGSLQDNRGPIVEVESQDLVMLIKTLVLCKQKMERE